MAAAWPGKPAEDRDGDPCPMRSVHGLGTGPGSGQGGFAAFRCPSAEFGSIRG